MTAAQLAQSPASRNSLIVSEQTYLYIPSDPERIEPTVELLREKAVMCGVCSESRDAKLVMALHEALTNSVVHGNLEVPSHLKETGDDSFIRLLAERASDPRYAERVVDIYVDFDGVECTWTFTDQGPGFDYEAILARLTSEDPDLLLASGRGILMMHSLMDRLEYDDGGRTVRLTMKAESGRERRSHPRFSSNRATRVAPIRTDGSIDWDAAYDAVALDISQGGVSLLQRQMHEGGRILIAIPGQEKPVYIPAEVRHCRTLDDDMVELGCKFQLDLPAIPSVGDANEVADVLGKYLEHLESVHQQQHAQRAYPRVPFTERIAIHEDATGLEHCGFCRDLSRGGVSFLAKAKIAGMVTAEFTPPSAPAPLRVRTEIVRCTKLQEGFYDIGGKFISLVKSA